MFVEVHIAGSYYNINPEPLYTYQNIDCELYQSVDCQYLELTFMCALCIIYIYVEEEVNRLCKQFPGTMVVYTRFECN